MVTTTDDHDVDTVSITLDTAIVEAAPVLQLTKAELLC